MFRRLKVYRTFITGILIGLFYAVIVSDKAATIPLPPWLNLVEQSVLVLTFSGILGGVLYTIVVDGKVELPRFEDNDSRFEAGLLGDILLGIAGAFILEFLTASRQPEDVTYISYAAKGIIGGYGSKALMNLALNKFLSRFEKLEAEKEEAEEKADKLAVEKEVAEQQVDQLKQSLLEGSQLISRLNEHIKDGVSDAALAELKEGILKAPPEVREQIFQLTKEFRSMSSRAEVLRSRTDRTIPVFEALIISDPENHAYYAQIAFAYKDATHPNYEKALVHINRAIALRGNASRAATWKYELNRAIIQIQKDYAETGTYTSDAIARDKIVQDLVAVTDLYSLSSVLQNAQDNHIPTPIVEWLIYNQAWLSENRDTKDLFASLKTALNDARLSSSPPEPTPRPPEPQPVPLPSTTPSPLPSTNGSGASPAPVVLEPQPGEPPVSEPLNPPEAVGEEPAPAPTPVETDVGSPIPVAPVEPAPVELSNGSAGSTRVVDVRTLLGVEAVKAVLQREVKDTVQMADWSSELIQAVRSGLVHLHLLDSGSDLDAVQGAWGTFKVSVNQSFPGQIEPESAALFLQALDDRNRRPPPDLEPEVEPESEPPDLVPWEQPSLEPWSLVLPNAPTDGASELTARQDGLGFAGVLASYQMARKDLAGVQKLLARFRRAGEKYAVPAAMLAAIASRESRCGRVLDARGMGDFGNAFGIMQIDKNHHTPAGLGGEPDSQVHIDQAAEILADNLKRLRKKYPDWEDAYILKAAAAAYNFGIGHIKTKEGIDKGTTGDDYGSDVIARAKFFAPYFNLSSPIALVDGSLASDKPFFSDAMAITQLKDFEARWLQEQLKRGGYYSGKVDGKIGGQTLNAFKQFKQDFHLEYPELIGNTTVEILEALEEPESNSDLQLSPSFKLSELIRSETASRYRINNYPNDEVVIENLKALCKNILEPLRAHYGKPITPNSGYRSPELNRRINGSASSQHMRGEAVDFVVPGVSIPEVCEWIRNHLEYDQLIMEHYKPRTNGGWVHCSYRRSGKNRKQFFKIPK